MMGDSDYYVDAHVHVWTDDWQAYPLASGFISSDVKPLKFPPEELLSHARPARVKRIVLVQVNHHGYDHKYLLDVMAAHPNVFAGIALLEPLSAKPGQDMIRLGEMGFRGFRVTPRGMNPDKWFEADHWGQLFRHSAGTGLPLCFLIDPDALPGLYGLCRRFPDTPVVIDHLARVGASGSVREADVRALCRLADSPNVRVKVSAFYALGEKRAPYSDLVPLIREVHEAFGARRLMWGSDCPFQVEKNHTYKDSVALVESLDFITENDKRWVMRRTAEELFYKGGSS